MSLHRILNNDGQGSPSVRGLSVTQLASPQPVIDPALAELSHPQPNGASRRAQGTSTRRSSRNQPTYSPPAISPLTPTPGQQPLSFRQYSPDSANPTPYERLPPPSSAGAREPYNGTEWNHQPEPQIQPTASTNQQPYFPNGNGHPQPPFPFVSPPHQVIDSTAPPEPQARSLPPDLPPKTPICIGQLAATALVLYPVNYLNSGGEQPVDIEKEWAPVRLSYEHNPSKSSGQDTIHIRTPTSRGTLGESLGGETFGVVEQRIASTVGPMLGKGLIRLEAKVRKGMPNVSSHKWSSVFATDACYAQSYLYYLSCSWCTRRKATSASFRSTSNNTVCSLITPRSRRTKYGSRVGTT